MLNEKVNSSGVQYAVIAGPRTEAGPERFVIAYSNEESLRDLIAAPSIIAIGFSSREHALASSRASVSTVTDQQTREARAYKEIAKYQHGFSWTGVNRIVSLTSFSWSPVTVSPLPDARMGGCAIQSCTVESRR